MGSPGPFDKKSISGLYASIMDADVFAGNTVMSNPLLMKLFKIFFFIPRSIITTCGLLLDCLLFIAHSE